MTGRGTDDGDELTARSAAGYELLRSDNAGIVFIIELTYTADLARIDASMRAHMQFINAHYASGHFVVSGRKIPRDGGIILAVGKDRAEIEAIASRTRSSRRGSRRRA